MTGVRRHNPFGAVTGWCALAVRALALLLALTLALPEAGLAADLHHHLDADHAALTVSPDSAVAPQAADPGLALHLHCGCHVAAPVSAVESVLPATRPLPRDGQAAEARSSIAPDLLPRPPCA